MWAFQCAIITAHTRVNRSFRFGVISRSLKTKLFCAGSTAAATCSTTTVFLLPMGKLTNTSLHALYKTQDGFFLSLSLEYHSCTAVSLIRQSTWPISLPGVRDNYFLRSRTWHKYIHYVTAIWLAPSKFWRQNLSNLSRPSLLSFSPCHAPTGPTHPNSTIATGRSAQQD